MTHAPVPGRTTAAPIPVATGASPGWRGVRLAMVTLLVISAVGPPALLAMLSASQSWFYPALLPTGWTADAWSAVVRRGPLARAVGTSVVLGLTTGVVGCVLAAPIGRALARLHGAARHVAVAAAVLPAAAPPIAVATGLQLTFVRAQLAGTPVGVVLAHLVPAVGVLSFFFFAVFTAYDTRLDDEARSLGASPRQVWLRVTLPTLRPQLGAGVGLGFLVSWGQVPLTLVIGGGRVHTLPLEVMGYVQAGETRFAAAAALLLILLPIVLLLVASARLVRGSAPASAPASAPTRVSA